MADYLQPSATGMVLSPGSGQRNPAQQPLSCTHCRQRKIKCDKKYPCSPCSRSNLNCVFPERARHPKKKSTGSKATNDELMRRLGRMEELIEKMKTEGQDVTGKKLGEDGSASPDTSRSRHTSETRSPGSNCPDPVEDGMSRYIGTHFWRSLGSEVGTIILLRSIISCNVFCRLANRLVHDRSKASRRQWTMTPAKKKKIPSVPANHQPRQAPLNLPYSLDLALFTKEICVSYILPRRS